MTCRHCGCELTLYEAHENAGSCTWCLKVIAAGGRIRRRPRDRALFDADQLGLDPEDDDARLC